MKVGDVVQLNSGGPMMTVKQYPYVEKKFTYEDRAKCIWFDNTTTCEGIFPTSMLTIIKTV